MHRYITHSVVAGALLAMGSWSWADIPVFAPPHGMLKVEVDANSKIFSNSGAGEFDFGTTGVNRFTTNAVGQTILFHDLAGGIAERDGNAPLNAATATSTKLLADDPGFFIGGGGFPTLTLVSVNFHNSLRYFAPGGGSWTAPVNGEQLRVFDITGIDNTGANDADLELFLTGGTSGRVGTINLDRTGTPPFPGFPTPGIHAHVEYELSRPSDNGIPAVGAYMMELTLSGRKFPTPGLVLTDSDPIFVIFNNRMNSGDFASAVAAARALPEPSTAVIVAAAGIGLIGVRRWRIA